MNNTNTRDKFKSGWLKAITTTEFKDALTDRVDAQHARKIRALEAEHFWNRVRAVIGSIQGATVSTDFESPESWGWEVFLPGDWTEEETDAIIEALDLPAPSYYYGGAGRAFTSGFSGPVTRDEKPGWIISGGGGLDI